MAFTSTTPAADQQLYQFLTQIIGQWSAATGIAPPSPAQMQAWVSQYGGGTNLQQDLGIESQNIGYYASRDKSLPTTTPAAILKAAEADPRWNELDAEGRQILEQEYNLQQSGFGGNLNQYSPLPTEPTAPSGDTGIGGPTSNGMTSSQQDAWSQIEATLASFGFTGTDLTNLVAWAKQEVISGNSAAQISLDLQQTPEFKARFPAIGVLSGEGIAITPAQYISLEQQYAQLEQSAGLPPNFASYDQLIAGQVSPSEYSARLIQGYLAVANADPTVVEAMQKYYGVGVNQLAAYFLNPQTSEPVLAQRALSAQIGGAAIQSNFSNSGQGVSQAQALRMVQMGVTQPQAQAGFQSLSKEQQLYGQMVGGGRVGNPLTTDQLLNAQFGSDGQTQLQLQLQAQFEKGTTAQGTQVASTQQGATGAGALTR